MHSPKTLQPAIVYFADFDRCREFLTDLRWPDGKVACPQCGSENVTYLDRARVWKCYGKHPKVKLFLEIGTVFSRPAVSLRTLRLAWTVALASRQHPC